MSPADAARLQAVYRRETASVLRYAAGAAPHVGPGDQPLATKLLSTTAGHEGLLAGFEQWLAANGVAVPLPGPFPMRFTDYNFLSVPGLVRRVTAERRAELAALEADAAGLTGDARAAVVALLEPSRKRLAELEG